MTLTHRTTVAVPDNGSSPIGTDEWHQDHTVNGTSLQVQYNNAGSLSGMSGTSWNDSGRQLSLTGGDKAMIVGRADTTYNEISFNGTSSFANALAIEGGATGDDVMYLNVPAGANFQYSIAGTPRFVVDTFGIYSIAYTPLGTSSNTWASLYLFANTFANVTSNFTNQAGVVAYITDSNTSTWGSSIAGGGANKVLAWYNGTFWSVIGK